MISRLAMTLALGGLVMTANAAQVTGPDKAKKKDDRLAKYLTADGKLSAALEVRDEKKGFGTFAGVIYHIEPNGQWSITDIFRRQPTIRAQGQLGKADLKKLAGALVQYDPLTLPNVGRPKVNPHVLTVQFGPKRSELTFGVDQVAARPDPSNPDPGLVGRYGGIAAAVREALKARAPRGIPVGGR